MEPGPADDSHLVFIHGLWMSGAESRLFRRRLEQQHGFRTEVFSYPTTREPLPGVLARLHREVRELGARTLHFVGHSLGGVIALRYLEAHHAETPPGRVVLLGAPVRGSLAATRLDRLGFGLGRSMVGPLVVDELVGRRERRWTCSRELGVIAGDQPIGLGRFVAMFDEPNDGTVAVAETRLDGAADRIVLPVSHLGMLLSLRVADECAAFLRTGHFGIRP